MGSVGKYAIDHPQIKDDAPYVRQVIFANDAYHFLVFDHAVEKSYVISQYEDDTKYGELLSKEARSITWTGDGFFLTGLDIDTQQLWYRRDHVSGDVLWEGTGRYGKPCACLLCIARGSDHGNFSAYF